MKAKLNSYLVGGGDLPMKFVRATSPVIPQVDGAISQGLPDGSPHQAGAVLVFDWVIVGDGPALSTEVALHDLKVEGRGDAGVVGFQVPVPLRPVFLHSLDDFLPLLIRVAGEFPRALPDSFIPMEWAEKASEGEAPATPLASSMIYSTFSAWKPWRASGLLAVRATANHSSG